MGTEARGIKRSPANVGIGKDLAVSGGGQIVVMRANGADLLCNRCGNILTYGLAASEDKGMVYHKASRQGPWRSGVTCTAEGMYMASRLCACSGRAIFWVASVNVLRKRLLS